MAVWRSGYVIFMTALGFSVFSAVSCLLDVCVSLGCECLAEVVCVLRVKWPLFCTYGFVLLFDVSVTMSLLEPAVWLDCWSCVDAIYGNFAPKCSILLVNLLSVILLRGGYLDEPYFDIEWYSHWCRGVIL